MLKRLNKTKGEGFTIIEVMIVLAIAGLILLIVLLAVPALQRNSRNTTIKNDASALAAALGEYTSNNSGSQPASISVSGSTVTIGASGTSQSTAKVAGSTTVNATKAKPSTYTPGQLWWNTGTTCDGTTNVRAITVYYYIETSTGSSTPQCVDAS